MVRSEHVDRFNHDEDAEGYDLDVRNEADPIRAGYEQVLTWVTGEVAALESAGAAPLRVLEFGSGTGNLTVRLLTEAGVERAVCIDVSSKMTDLARDKLSVELENATDRVQFLQCDLLQAFEHRFLGQAGGRSFDAAVSTYTLHHLTDSEKAHFFAQLAAVLRPGGHFIVGDLAFESARHRADLIERYRASGQHDLIEVIEDEFFFDLERDRQSLERAGFAVDTLRFSELSWGIHARLVSS